jgi:hypothetical protein
MLRQLLGAVLVLSGVVAGCVIFTGGTDGFTTAEAGPGGGGCKASSNCGVGQMCCYEPDAGTLSAICAPFCPPAQEACIIASDCGDGGSAICLSQSCPIDGGPVTSVNVTTCGAFPQCTQ